MNPNEIVKLLRKCSVGDCDGCPNRYVDEYEEGCGQLLAGAALLLELFISAAGLNH